MCGAKVDALRRVCMRTGAIGAVTVVALAGAATAEAHGHEQGHPFGRGGPPALLPGSGGPADTAWVRQIKWSSSSPVPGVTLLAGSFTDSASHPDWTVTIQAPTTSPFDGSAELAEAGSFGWAAQTETTLRADGFDPTATVLPWPQYADDPHGVMAVRVRVGDFPTQAAATTEAGTLTADGFAPLVEWTGFDPTPAPDAELLHVAIVDPARFDGHVIAYHGTAIASKQTAPAASAALNSVAATNGGFFTIDGGALTAVNGVNTGISAYNGQLQSLANGNRAALVLDGVRGGRAAIENLTTTATLSAVAARSGSSDQPAARQRRGLRRAGLRADVGVAPEHALRRPERHRAVHADVRRAAAAGAGDRAGRAGGARRPRPSRVGRRSGRHAAGRRLGGPGDRHRRRVADCKRPGRTDVDRVRTDPGWRRPAGPASARKRASRALGRCCCATVVPTSTR